MRVSKSSIIGGLTVYNVGARGDGFTIWTNRAQWVEPFQYDSSGTCTGGVASQCR
jgi:hypothetical protein